MDSLELFGEILEPQNNWEHNWDEECDREVAAVTWKVETEPLVKKSLQVEKNLKKINIFFEEIEAQIAFKKDQRFGAGARISGERAERTAAALFLQQMPFHVLRQKLSGRALDHRTRRISSRVQPRSRDTNFTLILAF